MRTVLALALLGCGEAHPVTHIEAPQHVDLTVSSHDQFIHWAAHARSDEHAQIARDLDQARHDPAVLDALFTHYRGDDHGTRLVVLSLIAGLGRAEAVDRLHAIAVESLPAHVGESHSVGEREHREMEQARAVETLAYLKTADADGRVLELAKTHGSRLVRVSGIQAYLYNHGDSDEAKATLRGVVDASEQVFVDLPRATRDQSAADFAAAQARFYELHPESLPPPITDVTPQSSLPDQTPPPPPGGAR